MSQIKFEHVHHSRFVPPEARNIGDFIKIFEEYLAMLKRWEQEGIQLDPHGLGSCYAIFYTYDEEVAKKEGFERIVTMAGHDVPSF